MDKINYFLYHIPGKKIGVTRDLISRVVDQQGYSLDEVEVLEQSTDIDYISDRELELQLSYGYRVDRQKYKDLYINQIKNQTMNINATEQTSTFPMPLTKLKGQLMDSIGHSWVTPQGYRFTITAASIPWIVSNARESMFNTNRCYIYNEAFNKHMQSLFEPQAYVESDLELGEWEYFDNIRGWAANRGIYAKGDVKTQFSKLVEEVGELAKAILEEDEIEFVDAIGDCVVVLTNLAHLGGYSIEECTEAAWIQISNRKGKMVNGTFVKQSETDNSAFTDYLKTKTQTL